MTLQEILNYKFNFRDCDAKNIKQYLKALLDTLWAEGEGFSGKRPFGNSSWEYDLYTALVVMGAVQGGWGCDEGYYYIEDFDKVAANKLVFQLIEEVFK